MVRRLNASQVLAALRSEPDEHWSSNDLVDATGMSRPTVLAAAQYLVELGWATEHFGRPAQGRGRPARTFAFRAEAGHVLGLDIGARTARAAVADLSGRVVAQAECSFRGPDIAARERLDATVDLAHRALREAELPAAALLAVCAGSSGTVSADGTVRLRTGIPGFLGVDLPAELGAAFPCPVVAENDCNLATLAERWLGVAAGARDVVCMLGGERLGVGIVLHDTLLRGHRGGAGELGFLRLMEDSSAGEGVATRARTHGARMVAELAARGGPSSPDVPGAALYALSAGDPDAVDARMVFEAVRQHDAAAGELLSAMLGPAARGIATVSHLLDPELVVVGGAVADAADVLLGPLRGMVAELVEEPPRLEFSPLRERAVVLGAVRLALDAAQERFQSLVTAPPAGG